MSFTLGPCRYCPAQVIWADTGRASMPVNPAPVPGGNVVLTARALGAPLAHVTADPADHPGQPRYTAHFDSCAGADQARRPRRTPPPQRETLF